jgi:cell division protein FtsL
MNTFKKPDDQKQSLLQQIKSLKFGFNMNIEMKSPIEMLPNFLFLTLLGIIYIANNYYYEKLYIEITELEKEVEDLRIDYSTLKYEYIYMSKRSEIARRVSRMGLQENDGDVYRIYVDEK